MKNFKSIKMVKDKNARSKRKMIPIFLISLGIIVLVVVFTTLFNNTSSQKNKQLQLQDNQHSSRNAIVAVDNDEIKFTADGTPYLIDPKRIRGGGPPKDGIPSIDNPKFISVEDADKWIDDDEFGLAIIHKGVKRFYSFQVLVWHEIVNDNTLSCFKIIKYTYFLFPVIRKINYFFMGFVLDGM